MATFIDWFCKRRDITELKPQDLEGPAFKIIKVFHPDVIHLQYQMEECHNLLADSVDDLILRNNVSKPLPLGGPPGQMKAAYYPDDGLEQMVLDQFWIDEECKYDIAAIVQNQQDESRFKYEVLDQEGRGSMQGIHVHYSEAFEDKADLSQPGELYWWTRQRGRLQTFEAY
nr:hypothetical protein [Tanacetum cinerariifolium]